jgi:hypothetical protein
MARKILYYLTPTAIYVLIKIFHRDIANSMKRDYVGPFPGVSAYIGSCACNNMLFLFLEVKPS